MHRSNALAISFLMTLPLALPIEKSFAGAVEFRKDRDRSESRQGLLRSHSCGC